MSLLRITKEEGHYTIKRVDRLPKRGNYNILYAMKTKTLNKFYRYLQDGEYEEISLGAVSINNTSDLINDGSDGSSTYVENSELSVVAISGDYNDLINAPSPGIQSVVAGTNVSVNNADPLNPIVNSTLVIPTLTSSFTNDGSDGNSVYVEADELATVATTGNYDDLINTPSPGIQSVVAGTNVTVDNTDPLNPIVNASGGGGGGGLESVVAGDNITVDNTDPANPEVSADGTDLSYNSSSRTVLSSTGTGAVIPNASSTPGLFRFIRIPLTLQNLSGTLSASSSTLSMYTMGPNTDDYKQVNGSINTINGTVPPSTFAIVIEFSGGVFTNTTTFLASAAAGAVYYSGISGDFHNIVIRVLGSNQLAISAIDSSTGNVYDFSNATFNNAVIKFTVSI